jgi:hypothetical protein
MDRSFFMVDRKTDRYTFTQQQWDRVVGYGKVPDEYRRKDEDGTSTDKRHQRFNRNTTH